MKSYDDLSDAEEDKLKMYLLARSNANSSLKTLIIIATMFYIPGLILLFANDMQLFLLGGLLVGMSLLTIIYIVKLKEEDDKHFFLAFGITNFMEDVFEIKKSDIDGLKKKWIIPKRKKSD